jgi:hypothetical protein
VKEAAMFRLVEVKQYKDGHGHRFVFRAEAPVFLRRGRGLPRIFIPKGGQVEVSIVNLPHILGGFEAAIIYNNTFIAFHRSPTLTAEEALNRTLVLRK